MKLLAPALAGQGDASWPQAGWHRRSAYRALTDTFTVGAAAHAHRLRRLTMSATVNSPYPLAIDDQGSAAGRTAQWDSRTQGLLLSRLPEICSVCAAFDQKFAWALPANRPVGHHCLDPVSGRQIGLRRRPGDEPLKTYLIPLITVIPPRSYSAALVDCTRFCSIGAGDERGKRLGKTPRWAGGTSDFACLSLPKACHALWHR